MEACYLRMRGNGDGPSAIWLAEGECYEEQKKLSDEGGYRQASAFSFALGRMLLAGASSREVKRSEAGLGDGGSKSVPARLVASISVLFASDGSRESGPWNAKARGCGHHWLWGSGPTRCFPGLSQRLTPPPWNWGPARGRLARGGASWICFYRVWQVLGVVSAFAGPPRGRTSWDTRRVGNCGGACQAVRHGDEW